MVASTSSQTPGRRLTALAVETGGEGVVLRIDGAERRLGSEAEVHRAVDGLARDCRRQETALWRAHVRLGAALEQIAGQVPWGHKKSIYVRLGVNAAFGQKCRRLARAVCDAETWIVDERRLAERIAESRRRERGQSESGTDEKCGAPHKLFGSTEQGDGVQTPHPDPLPRGEREEEAEGVDLDRVSEREIERAVGLRRPSKTASGLVSPPRDPARVHDGARPGLKTPPQGPGGWHRAPAPGEEEEFSRGDLGGDGRRDAAPTGDEGIGDRRLEASSAVALTGEQIEMAELYELAGRARRAAGVVTQMTDSELIDVLGSLGVDGLESVVDAFEMIGSGRDK